MRGNFEMFNRARIPCNSYQLRQALFKGPILGEMLRKATAELTSNTKQELRYSIKVKTDEGLKTLAKFWMKEHLRSEQVHPIIQVAKTAFKLQLEGHVSSLQDFQRNIFSDALKRTRNPAVTEEDCQIKLFLNNLGGIDFVDQEIPTKSFATFDPSARMTAEPSLFQHSTMAASFLCPLNEQRAIQNLEPICLILHCGEGVNVESLKSTIQEPSVEANEENEGEATPEEDVHDLTRNLILAFLDSLSICHGIYLKENAALRLLYMMCQVGVSMSVSSNHFLYLDYEENPIRDFFNTGLRVTVSTDDALIFHKNRNALTDQYSKVALTHRFSNIGIAELKRNSVLIGTHPLRQKQDWLGKDLANPLSRIAVRERIFNRALERIYED
jgi:adenosine deaminase